MTFLELSARRYSTRSFSPKPVEEEKLSALYEVIRNAPSAKNLQGQRVYVVQSEEGLKKANEASPCIYGAPLVFIVCIDMDIVWKHPDDPRGNSADIDGAIVTTQLALEAADLGLGSVIVRYFDPVKTKELFNMPDNLKPILYLPVGYPAEGSGPSPRHTDRKPIEDMIELA